MRYSADLFMTTETEDGYIYALQKLRGDVRGLLKDSLKRKLETALDAARATDPFLPCTIERLEDSLREIENFLKKLPD